MKLIYRLGSGSSSGEAHTFDGLLLMGGCREDMKEKTTGSSSSSPGWNIGFWPIHKSTGKWVDYFGAPTERSAAVRENSSADGFQQRPN